MDKFKSQLVALMRNYEARAIAGDKERLEQLAATTDDYLLKKTLWTLLIVGGPAVFLLLPFVVSLLGAFLPQPVNFALWTMTKVLMSLILALLALTIYFTFKSDN